MNNEYNTEGLTDHTEFSALIPWYVNDTLDDRQRTHLEAHLERCGACRSDLQLERRMHEHMTADAGIEYMPAPSLKRLRARLDALDASDPDSAPMDAERPATARPVRREVPWKSRMAAAVAVIAVALGVFAGDQRLHAPASPRNYHTVTNPVPREPDEVIRAVFVPSITLIELQALLDEAQLRIVAGPSEAGVYSLAATSDRAVTASLQSLRGHAAVRFAESTQSAAAPDAVR